ncbi:hypothetical protein TNCV_3821451 [Trichonephila clavipes]|nr:hypothetical protein TNCV_3821451 [Trichonephila clavipes]
MSSTIPDVLYSGRSLVMVREDTGARSEDAACAWTAANEDTPLQSDYVKESVCVDLLDLTQVEQTNVYKYIHGGADSSGKFRGVTVSSMGTTNHHRTWRRKPCPIGGNYDDSSHLAIPMNQTKGLFKQMRGFGALR